MLKNRDEKTRLCKRQASAFPIKGGIIDSRLARLETQSNEKIEDESCSQVSYNDLLLLLLLLLLSASLSLRIVLSNSALLPGDDDDDTSPPLPTLPLLPLLAKGVVVVPSGVPSPLGDSSLTIPNGRFAPFSFPTLVYEEREE